MPGGRIRPRRRPGQEWLAAKALLAALCSSTEELLAANWDKVERVAAALLEHGELTQDGIDAAMGF